MAPIAESRNSNETIAVKQSKGSATVNNDTSSGYPRAPLQLSGILDQYKHQDLTPAIGREYYTIQLRDLLHASNSDELLRELAITISRRGVVFFKSQDITPDEQKLVTDKLGQLAGKPKSSTLHIHPVINSERKADYQALDEKGTANKDDTISVISSKGRKAIYENTQQSTKTGAEEWHSDITFEPIPADYTSLKVHTLPNTGGDTIWASGYELYDQLSPQLQAFADTLVARCAQPRFNVAAQLGGFRVHPGPRGAPENVGEKLEALHPFIRTNPVTGWKSVFGAGHHFQEFEGLKSRESDVLRSYITELLTSHHAAQVRYRWAANDLAIWDNRSTFHAATPDYEGLGDRAGVRAVSLGEKPYFDPFSRSRGEDLGNGHLI